MFHASNFDSWFKLFTHLQNQFRSLFNAFPAFIGDVRVEGYVLRLYADKGYGRMRPCLDVLEKERHGHVMARHDGPLDVVHIYLLHGAGGLPHLDGIECWNSTHDLQTVAAYVKFARQEGLLVTGGSDCHQQPVIIGSVKIPSFVADQFPA